MTEKKIPITIEEINESIYAGFWTRLGSLLLDFLILLPYTFLILFINSLSKSAYYFTCVPSLIFYFWFNIYLVKRYGGTPGKLIVGIKVLRIDGSDITWREAILRASISYTLTLFSFTIAIIALARADEDIYQRLSWIKKQQYMISMAPLLFTCHTWLNNLWVYSELIVLLFNKRKRALHDFIANTVIVKTRHISKIRQEILKDTP